MKKIANYSNHDVINKIHKDFAKDWKEKINIILEILLYSYDKFSKENSEKEKERIKNVKKEMQ